MENESMPQKTNPEFINADDLLPKTILNSLSANIAILDAQGVIIETNRAWRNYADGRRK